MVCKLLWLVLLFTIATVGEAKQSAGKACNRNDLKGLISFKAGIHVDTSGRLAKWVGRSCCNWEGVTCDNTTGRVTAILLAGFISTDDFILQSEMKGWLSPSITLLSFLEVIDLGGLINLAGTIPPAIGFRLPRLRKLYLYGNKLSGSVPHSIGQIPDRIGEMQALEKLDLSNNLLRGKIPISLTGLNAISELYLDTNCLEGAIPFPSSSGQMSSLGFLKLNDNNLTGTIPANFGYLVSLQRVSLANNKLAGVIPSSLGNLSALTELYLNGNLLSGQIPKSISLLSRLILLSISHNFIQGPFPCEFSSLQNLQTLDLSFNHLDLVSFPKCLAEMPSLSRIYLAGCGIHGEIPAFLQTTPSPIQELDLSTNHLTGSLPPWLGSLTQLYSLNLSRNFLVSSIPDSVTNLQHLGVLDLHSNKITGPISKIFEICSAFSDGSLTYIDLSDNIFSGGIQQIGVGGQVGIQYLNLSRNILEGEVRTSIGRMKSLQTLDLSCNKFGFTLPEALANVSSLERLKLQKNHFTGKIPVGFLKLRKLKELNLSDNLLVGEIPIGKPLSEFPWSSFSGNKGLCGKPLTPCKVRGYKSLINL
ncbi:LRR receptor-like serine/threonine-protein kinase GSO1 isoform X2 [Ricinus communis]|uniref:LRR receptor-like serine/threonine-protein kinase GSO1 isoform X2 n=1 Tax=Ricinus communis TaxID=3988 RepID=UPI00201AD945|nr:LRR receptor-like serine/threonine-protein kinase GSO1 isoform X2 [Ricinus communis]